MAKRTPKKEAPVTDPAGVPAESVSRPGPVTFGGSLVREMGSLPGLLQSFVTISRKYPRAFFIENRQLMTRAFSHVNKEAVVDDFGKNWPPGSLLHLGGDGRDEGEFVFIAHKFVPIEALYSPLSFAFLAGGERF